MLYCQVFKFPWAILPLLLQTVQSIPLFVQRFRKFTLILSRFLSYVCFEGFNYFGTFSIIPS